MKILFLCTAFNSLSQRVALVLREKGHNVTVEYAISPEVMIEAANLAQPDLVLCPFLTKRVPKEIYDKWLTLIVHPGAPGDAGPSALDWVLFGDDGSEADASVALTKLTPPSDPSTTVQPRQWWGVTVLQAIEELDGGPIWAWDQFKVQVDGTPSEILSKSALYRGPVTRAAVSGTLAAVERIMAAAGHDLSKIGPALIPPPHARTQCVTQQLTFQGGPTHDRPLLKPAQRDFDIRVHSTHFIARRIRCGDSQPGVLTRLFSQKTPLFIYDGVVEENPFPSHVAELAKAGPGTIVAQRQGAVLVSTADGKGIWISHVRRSKAKTDKYLPPKLPAVMGLSSVPGLAEELKLSEVKEWNLVEELGSWEKKDGTYQPVWVEVKEYPSAAGDVKVAYVFSDFYNGATSTSQARLLISALEHTLSTPSLRALVLMGGAYFNNGIALNVIEGSADPGAESWANINAINDIVKTVLDPSNTSEKGIVTIAAIRGNVSAGGLAVATATDVVLCAEAAVINPHYRGMGLYGSEYHTRSFYSRAGEEVAKRLLREMLPMSAKEGREVGLVDRVLGDGTESPGEVDRLVYATVQEIVTAQAPETATQKLQIDDLLLRKAARLSKLPPFETYRETELNQMRLDFFHPVRSQRYHSRRLAFVRKVAPVSTPVRFALHRRWGGAHWNEYHQNGPVIVDEEELDEFDGLGDVPDEAAVIRMPVPVAVPRTPQQPMVRREPNHLQEGTKAKLLFECYYEADGKKIDRRDEEILSAP